ncbi:hypothetical protein [Salmonella enterica]|uniref:hypothetical protein n=1 Tax=Salmonella enterica TaxID=28901 RepID=UPI0009B21BC2|nr:hypothetical protein [Salmonella enterica]
MAFFIPALHISALLFSVKPLLARLVGVFCASGSSHKKAFLRHKCCCIPRHVWLSVFLLLKKRVFASKYALFSVCVNLPVSLVLSGLRPHLARFSAFTVLHTKISP